MSEREIRATIPNLTDRMYLLRPTQYFSEPPLCTVHELRTVYTIDDLADMHEVLDFKGAEYDRIMKNHEAERNKRASRRG